MSGAFARRADSADVMEVDRSGFGGALSATPDGPDLAPRLAKLIVIAVFGCMCLVAALHVLFFLQISALDRALCITYMAAMLTLQWRHMRPDAWPRSRGRPWVYGTLAAQAGLAYLPFLQFEQAWAAMPGFLAGSLLLTLPALAGWLGFGLIVLSMGYIQYLITGMFFDIAYTSVSTVIIGLSVYGLTRLASLVSELHAARNEIARLAVARERLRVSRDLHDLLGYSISAIALKSELTHRLLAKNPERAREEVADILDISRQALSDVRSVANGYRELSLDEESRSARSVLCAANVDVKMEVRYDNLPEEVLTVLATVLREGVTNVLRHSKAEHCEIIVSQDEDHIDLEIVNDGVSGVLADDISRGESTSGSGIENLSERVGKLNGAITAGVDADGQFRLRASIPVELRSNGRAESPSSR